MPSQIKAPLSDIIWTSRSCSYIPSAPEHFGLGVEVADLV